jgi:hypothetical protein
MRCDCGLGAFAIGSRVAEALGSSLSIKILMTMRGMYHYADDNVLDLCSA